MQISCREVLRCLLEGLTWLLGPGVSVRIAGRSGISQARSRLGLEPVQRLHDELVRPIARPTTRGAWYRDLRVVSLDGSTLDVADTVTNTETFGRPASAHGRSAYPKLRFVALLENGTHVLFGTRMAGYGSSELVLAREVVDALGPGMLCLADRAFFGFDLWTQATARGAALLWRVKANLRLARLTRLPDGSYLSQITPSRPHRGQQCPLTVRVIEYTLAGVPNAEPSYRLLTTLLDPAQAHAHELAALYHERWEIETALDELKTHLRGAQIVLRSKTRALVRQKFYGLLMAHFAIRGLMHEAALKAEIDPDRLSFVHAVRVVCRTLPRFVALPPSAPEGGA
jgi:hypothetical protein